MRGKVGVPIDPFSVIMPVSIRKVEQIPPKFANVTLYVYPFVNKVTFPSAVSPVIQANLAIGIPP